MLCKPYKLKGRWYKFFVESNGENLTLTTSDLKGVVISSRTLKFPEKFRVLHAMFDFNTEGGTATSALNLDLIIKRYGNGQQGVNIGEPTAYDYGTIYVYGYYGK